MIAGYQDDKLVLLNIVNKNYTDADKKSVIISSYKNPKFNDEEFELKVLDFLLKFSKYEMNAERVYFELISSDENSINYLKNNKFDIYKTNDKIMIYKKELDKEGV